MALRTVKRGSTAAGSEAARQQAWLISRQHGSEAAGQPGWSIRTARSRLPASKGRTGLPSEEWTVDGIGGSGSVAGCLGAAPERGCQGILFGGEYDDSGWGVLDGWRAGSRIGPPPPPQTQTTTAPHKCPTWGIDQTNRTMHPHPRSLALNMVPKGDPRDRGFRTVFTHRKQESASDHPPQTTPPHHKPTHPTQFEIQIPEFR